MHQSPVVPIAQGRRVLLRRTLNSAQSIKHLNQNVAASMHNHNAQHDHGHGRAAGYDDHREDDQTQVAREIPLAIDSRSKAALPITRSRVHVIHL